MTSRNKAELILLGTTVIWGGTFSALKLGLNDLPPVTIVAIRFTAATLLFLTFLHRRLFPLSKEDIRKGCLLGLFLFLGFAAQNIGLTSTTASKSAFITSMMVVFVPVLQLVIERRSPTRGNILGIAVVTLGLWLMTAPRGAEFNIGDALTVACAFIFGLYVVYLDIFSNQMTAERLTFLQFASVSGFAWVTASVSESMTISFTTLSLGSLLYLTLLATVLTTYVQTRYQKDTTPTRAAIIFTIEPVFASIFASWILAEHLTVVGAAGGGMIILGVLISELSDRLPALSKSAFWRSGDSGR